MKTLEIIGMALFIIAFFPLVTKIINKEKTNELFKEVTSPNNIVKVSDKGADEAVLDLTEWEKQIGIYREGVYLKTIAPGIRGLYTSRDIEPKETVIVSPLKSMIYEDFITDDPIIKKAQKLFNGDTLIALMIHQEMRNPNTRFKPYFAIFPQDLGNFPVFFTSEDFKFIQGTSQYRQIQSFIQGVIQRYDAVIKQIPELKDMTREEFYKVHAYSASRSLSLPINGKNQYAMVPLFDMVNAFPPKRPDLNCVHIDFNVPPGDQSLLVVINRKLKAEQEILEFYQGHFSNTEFLLYYGFVFPDVHEVTFNINLDEYAKDDPNIEKKKELMGFLERVYLSNDRPLVTVHNSTKEEDYWPLYSVVRILELNNAKAINALINEFKEKKRKTIGRISKENEQRAMNNLLNIVESVLENYPSSAEEDEKLMNELQMYSTRRNLVQLRYDERVGLMNIKNYCLNSLAAVTKH